LPRSYCKALYISVNEIKRSDALIVKIHSGVYPYLQISFPISSKIEIASYKSSFSIPASSANNIVVFFFKGAPFITPPSYIFKYHNITLGFILYPCLNGTKISSSFNSFKNVSLLIESSLILKYANNSNNFTSLIIPSSSFSPNLKKASATPCFHLRFYIINSVIVSVLPGVVN